ncbi:MAG: 1-deoxy-D-xylulose-5-phosphate reductoisomerase [Planctomyces sp.]|nr:1-deoxy-D-xylulose-5-phosphate reductoisomerase [Planctomyces sp.]
MSTPHPTPSTARARPADGTAPIRVLILGSTGSIGTQTLDVVAHLNALHALSEHPDRYVVVGLAAGSSHSLLLEQAQRFGVTDLALAAPPAGNSGAPLRAGATLRTGPDAALQLVRDVPCDVVVAAMVGAAGLPATLEAARLGRRVALANKETLVAAGGMICRHARRSGAQLLPLDSEHSALWQCLQELPGAPGAQHAPCPPMPHHPSVARLILTASGGPFRTRTAAEAYHASPQEALRHPTWSMGAKVTIDSASLTNKALELIEAHWLFGVPGAQLEALIHPQSVVHSMVEFQDGSVIAQLGASDMRTPIQYALTYPRRAPGCSKRLDLAQMTRLDFQPASHQRFPALALAYRVIAQAEADASRPDGRSDAAGAVFNAASEEATTLFLAGAVPFGSIPEHAQRAMDQLAGRSFDTLDELLSIDAEARRIVRQAAGVAAASVVAGPPRRVPSIAHEG